MKKHFKRISAILLALVIVLGSGTVSSALKGRLSGQDRSKTVRVFSDAEHKAVENDVFASIDSIKEAALSEKTYTEGHSAVLTEADYIDLIPDVIAAVESSATYAEGTLQQNGNFLVWETVTGIPCCYSPRMEAKLRGQGEHSGEMLLAEEEPETVVSGSGVSVSAVSGHSPSSTSIGLIQPYWESNSNYADYNFCSYSPAYKTMWQQLYQATGGTGMRYSMTNANINNIADTMEQCAIVIFDSHGTTDYEGSNYDYTSRANSSYLCLTTSTGITTADTARKTGPYGTYFDCIKGDGYAYVNGTCIANHMDHDAPNSLLYMGICLGMATDKMFSGLRAKGVEVVYGYSQSVSFYGEKLYMQSILGNVKNGDTFATAVSKAKSAYGKWDPAYNDLSQSEAVAEMVAFPITVSSEDTYPGHGNVDAVQNVYSTWTLFLTYNVTAVSNNTNYGTVSIDGYTITATPKTGYRVSGYQVTQGTATVTQNGNKFTVTPSSDCTVKIIFAPKTAISITCYADGEYYQTVNGYASEPVSLPSAAPEKEGWSFVGWAAEEVGQTSESPYFTAPGASVTLESSAVMYAVYRAADENASSETVYELVTSAPYDWSGDYVITNGTTAAYVMKGISGNNKSYEAASSGGSAALASTGITLAGNALHNVTDSYVFTIAPLGSGYSIRNIATGTYLASANNTLKSVTALNGITCTWNLSMNGTLAVLQNSSSSAYPYLAFSSNGYFKVNNTANSAICLWRSGFENYIYTTAPSAAAPQPVTYTVSFSVPEGVEPVETRAVEEGSSFELPAAQAPEGYSFLGWTEEEYDNVTDLPGTVLTGTYAPEGNVTLNALYSYTEAPEQGFELLTTEPSDWTGRYVITFGNDSGLYVLKGLPRSEKAKTLMPMDFTAMEDTEMILSGNMLKEVGDEYVFQAEANDSRITLRNVKYKSYLASRNNKLYGYPSLSTAFCLWTPSMNRSSAVLQNTASSLYPYLTFSEEDHFTLGSAPEENIYLWKDNSDVTHMVYTTLIR